MSDDEKALIVGKVVLNHEAAKKHLAALQAKGKMVGKFVHLVANALTGNAVTYTVSGSTIKVAPFHSSPGGEGTWPTIDEVTALLAEIDSTKRNIVQFEQQRKALGV